MSGGNNGSSSLPPGPAYSPGQETTLDGLFSVLGYLCLGIGIVVVAGFVMVGTRYRLWHSNSFLSFYINAVCNPGFLLFGQLLLITLKKTAGVDLTAPLLLYALFSSYLSTGRYNFGRDDRWEEIRTQEVARAFNGLTVLWFLLMNYEPVYSGVDVIGYVIALLFIWLLGVLKIVQRVISFYDGDRLYGVKHSDLVAMYMAKQSDPSRSSTVESRDYIVHGEPFSLHGIGGIEINGEYTFTLQNEKAIITVDDVLSSEGWVLTDGDPNGTRKDLCLSFAMFKLLKKWIHESPIAEARREDTCGFIVEQLRAGDDASAMRVFGIASTELKFFFDLFYTKHSVTFGAGLILLNFSTIAMTAAAFYAVIKNRTKEVFQADYGNYQPPPQTLPYDAQLLLLVVCVEIFIFLRYLISDWSKAICLARYCRWRKNHKPSARPALWERVLALACERPLARTFFVSVPQYSLLKKDALRRRHSVCARVLSCGKKGDKLRMKKDRRVPLSTEVKKAVIHALRELLSSPEPQLSCGSEALRRHDKFHQLGWACDLTLGAELSELLGAPIATIMVWHIATWFCFMAEEEFENPPKPTRFCFKAEKELETPKQVAIVLSKYCAHAVFDADLLPHGTLSSKIFDHLIEEVRKFFNGATDEREMYGEMKKWAVDNPNDTSMLIIHRGCRLGQQIMDSFGEADGAALRWTMLKEFWAELLLFMAPTTNQRAHEKKLMEGGELITLVWVILYHVGILKRPDSDSISAQERGQNAA